jgi:succinoglycan biosynthesis transport protein ExoP
MSLETHVVRSPGLIRPETGEEPISRHLSNAHLARIRAFFMAEKNLILATTLFCFLASIAFYVVTTPQYTATTQILIDPTDLRVVENGVTANNHLADAIVIQVESQVRVLRSDNVLRRVISREGLDRDTEFVGSQGSILGLLLRPVGRAPDDPTLQALYELQRRVQVRRAERTFVVDVSVRTAEREKSVRIANAIAEAYFEEQTNVRSDAARRASESLVGRLNELKDRVKKAEERVEEFKVRKNIFGAGGQLVNEQQLSELNNQLTLARGRTAAAKARVDLVRAQQRSGGDLGGFTEAVQSQTVMALRSQYAEILRREAEQMTSLGPRHPAVIEQRAQAQRLRTMINEEINRIAEAASTDYTRAKANEDSLANTLEELKRNTTLTNDARVGLRELDRDVQASRTVYESFLVRSRETGEQEQLDTKNVRIISKADTPQRRSWPPSYLLVMLGSVMFGASAGTAIAFWRAQGGPLRRVEEPETDLPLLAKLPPLPSNDRLSALADPNGWAGMELRRLYDAVRAGRSRWVGQSILLLSPEDDAGAATVAMNLAMLAAANHNVLLIDADPQGRMIASLLGRRSEAGLMDVASGRKVLSEAVIRDPNTHIHVLPLFAGKAANYRDVGNEELANAFVQTSRYDLVVVAGTAENGSPLGAFFAALVQQIVLITHAGAARERHIDDVLESFGDNARKVCGTVLLTANR